MHLPIMSGLDILRKLKRDINHRHIPVIMLTSSRFERDILDAYEIGATSYIVKPIDQSKLRIALHNLNELNDNSDQL